MTTSLFVEDLITLLAKGTNMPVSQKDITLITSFAKQILSGNALTQKQANISVSILKKYSGYLEKVTGISVLDKWLNPPTFRFPPRAVSQLKHVSICNDQYHGKLIKLEFPYNDSWLLEVKKAKEKKLTFFWDKDSRSWNFLLQEQAIGFVIKFIEGKNFTVDAEFENFQINYKKLLENIDIYVPMLTKKQNDLKFVNISPFLPKLESKNTISALFEARKRGIFTWDTNIDQYIDSDQVTNTTREFIRQEPLQPYFINALTVPLFDLKDIVLNLTPSLFVIPGGSELEILRSSLKFLHSIGIKSEEISVLFRLPNETDKEFNQFIKLNHLNNAISEITKVVAVSSKIPKTIIKSKIRFHLILSFGTTNTHYTMRDYLKRHENLVVYSQEQPQYSLPYEDKPWLLVR